jgi:hypothetical protein
MTSPNTEAPLWFSKLIETCLAGLYLLNLDGCPAADSVGKTARLWVRLLWDDPRVRWHEEADTPRIREAFRSMASGCNRWPAPAKFWEHVRDRPKPTGKQLFGPEFGREREREALHLRKLWLESLGRDHAGDIIPGHPNAPVESAP